jgi:hypothetical protein
MTRVVFVTEDGAWHGVDQRAKPVSLTAHVVGLDAARDTLKELNRELHAARIERLQSKALAFLEANRDMILSTCDSAR